MQGRIACCNVLSDLYAMGLTKVDTILMILGVCNRMSQEEKDVCTRLMIKGFNDCASEAGTSVTGGQTVYNPYPLIGGTAISVPKREKIVMPNFAKSGDLLVLTKPVGTQPAVNLKQWHKLQNKSFELVKDIITETELLEAYKQAELQMATLNYFALTKALKYKINGCTDITGFGLLGHCQNLALVQKAKLRFVISTVPVIKNMMKIDKIARDFKIKECLSPETSGGLMMCMSPSDAQSYCATMKKAKYPVFIIGRVEESDKREVIIDPNVAFLEV